MEGIAPRRCPRRHPHAGGDLMRWPHRGKESPAFAGVVGRTGLPTLALGSSLFANCSLECQRCGGFQERALKYEAIFCD